MSATQTDVLTTNMARTTLVRKYTDDVINELLNSLPSAERLSAEERRGIIARYTAVLEGNFIYWMTGAYLSAGSTEARSIVIENLREEIRDCHPAMLRRFAIAANAVPTDSDVFDVYGDVLNVRLFIGRLSPVPLLAMMAFFEGFIQRFMVYLADLARRQGSSEMEYTDVHGECDIAHTEGLYNALGAETALLNGLPEPIQLFEGIDLLRTVIRRIVHDQPATLHTTVNGTRQVYAAGRIECQP